MKPETELRHPLPKICQHVSRISRPLKTNHEVSRPGEFHPQALAEPYVNVSAHTAPIIQLPDAAPANASEQTSGAHDRQYHQASTRPWAYPDSVDR